MNPNEEREKLLKQIAQLQEELKRIRPAQPPIPSVDTESQVDQISLHRQVYDHRYDPTLGEFDEGDD